MARHYSRSRRRRRPRRNRRGRNQTRSYLTLLIVVAVGSYGIYWLWFGQNPASQTDPNDLGILSASNLPSDTNITPRGRLGAGRPDAPASRTLGGDGPLETREPSRQVVPPPVERVVAVPSNPEVNKILGQAMNLLKSNPNRIIEVRETLNDVLKGEQAMPSFQREGFKDELAKLSQTWLFSKTVYDDDTLCETYLVQSGDRLESIGNRYKVPYELLMTINSIAVPSSLQAGKHIKVVKGPFRAHVYRSEFTMDLYLQDTYVKTYQVGLGRPGQETPLGKWVVKEGGRLIRPPWTDPDTGQHYRPEDPDYPLGSRWIAIRGIDGDAIGRTGFAIHGTKSPSEIGRNASRGCIRLHNGNAREVYDVLIPSLSEVWVHP